MQENLTRIRISVVIVLSISIGLILGIALDRQVINTQAIGTTAASNSSGNFQLLNDAWNIIQKNYVDRSAIDQTKLTYAAISGMVDGLGDTGHSRFLTPEMLKSEQTFTRGEFEGIGAIVEMKDNHVTIVSPIDNSPAQKAGLRAGDIITKVNGQSVDGLSLDEVVNHIVGPAGSQVVVSILHPGAADSQDYTLTRAKITVNNVTWQWIPGTKIAHLRLAAFSSGVTDDLQKALIEIKASGATGIILDMRNNPGGLLSEAVGVASQFLDSGVVLEEKNANGKIDSVSVQPGGVATQIPMDVLVNQGTASAAEIVTGALQDAHRAAVIGETTIGTGTVLNTFDLPDGSALLLATQEWLTPKGRVIWHQGLTPDIEVKMDSGVYPLSPEAERQMTFDQWKTIDDIQLLKAFETLNSK
jgi:carboxyl-terminal processing protease